MNIYPRATGRRAAPDLALVGAMAAGLAIAAAATVVGPTRAGLVLLAAVAVAPFASLAAVHLQRVLIAVVLFDLPFQWDFSVFYNAPAAATGAQGGLLISMTTFALAGLYAQWAAERVAPRSTSPKPDLAAARPLIVYVAICAASLLGARNVQLGSYQVVMLIESLLLFVYFASTLRTRKEISYVLGVLMAAILAEGILTLVVSALGVRFSVLHLDMDLPARDEKLAAFSRFGGTIGGPNTAAAFYGLTIPLILATMAAPVERIVRRLAAAAAVVAVPCLFITGSRAGAISATVSAGLLAIILMRKKVVAPSTVLGFGLVLVILALPLAPRVSDRITSDDNGSAASRGSMNRLAEEMIEGNPILGLGINNVGINLPDYAGPEFTRTFVYTIHNKYLLTAAESGLLALAAFLWFLAATLARGWRTTRASDPYVAVLGAGILTGLIGSIGHMTVDIFNTRPQVQLLFFMGALLVALDRLRAAADEEAARRRPRRSYAAASAPPSHAPRPRARAAR